MSEVERGDNQGSGQPRVAPSMCFRPQGVPELCFPSLFWVVPMFSPERGSHYFPPGFKGFEARLVFLCLTNSQPLASHPRNHESQKLKPVGIEFHPREGPYSRCKSRPGNPARNWACQTLNFSGRERRGEKPWKQYPDRAEGQKTDSDSCPEQRILFSQFVRASKDQRQPWRSPLWVIFCLQGRTQVTEPFPVEKGWEGGSSS